MRTFVVTIRIPKNPEHNPQKKQVGPCPVAAVCTDVTGEHHSFVIFQTAMPAAKIWAERYAKQAGGRITRIEQATIMDDGR